jgi:hypothetical protein
MDNVIPINIALDQYNELLKVKPMELQSKYPFSAMNEEEVVRTLKQIELVYQNLTPTVSAFVLKDKKNDEKKIGGSINTITIFTI